MSGILMSDGFSSILSAELVWGIAVDGNSGRLSSPVTMKNEIKKSNGNNAQATLAQINAEIEILNQKRISLAEPLKIRYAELRTELTETEIQIRDLDSTWKPAPTKPKGDEIIRQIISKNGAPMSEAEIIAAVGVTFTKWKTRQILKKKFKMDDKGKYSVASV